MSAPQFSYALLPVVASKKNSYSFNSFNFSELSKQLETMLETSWTKIASSQEFTKDVFNQVMHESMREVFFAGEVKKVEQEEKKKADKANKAPTAPSAYILYSNSVTHKIKETHPELSFADRSRHIGSLWSGLSDEEKQPFVDQHEAIKAQIKAGTYVKPESSSEKAKKEKAESKKEEAPKAEAKAPSKKEEKAASTKTEAKTEAKATKPKVAKKN